MSALAASAYGQSGSVTLAWDPSPSSSIVGYRLHIGGASRVYTNVISAIGATTFTVSGLARGGTYFFAVTAYNAEGLESVFSKEVSCTIPRFVSGPPVTELTSPVSGAVYAAPATINLAATATSGTKVIRQVEFYSGAMLLGTASAPSYGFTWDKVGAGNYSVRAVAVYESGGRLDSAAVNVIVAAAQPPAEVTFTADSGRISSPFVANSGAVFQSAQTGFTNSGRAVYRFNIARAGRYIVSAMVCAPSEGQNSFYVNIDAEPTDPLMIWDIPPCATLTRHSVSWRGNGNGNPSVSQYSPKVFTLSAGAHVLIVRGREVDTRLGAISVAEVPPKLQVALASGEAVVLSGTGQPGQSYWVLSSENLTSWRAIGTVTADTQGAFQFSDPGGSGAPRRMYRLLSIAITPPTLQIGGVAGGFVNLTAAGQAGQTYAVQCSQDFQTWTDIGSMTLDENGLAEFSDPDGSSRPNCFYRLKGQ